MEWDYQRLCEAMGVDPPRGPLTPSGASGGGDGGELIKVGHAGGRSAS